MRGFSENRDVGEVKSPQIESFKEIRPENGMTVDDARSFWDEKFRGEQESKLSPVVEVLDGKAHYYDDKGALYRVDKELSPDAEYELNGYKYMTDDSGRIVSAEGTLHLKGDRERLSIRDSIEDIGKGDQFEGDDRGHLIGDQFDGANGLENMIPQDSEINRNDFKNFESELADALREKKEVYIKIEPIYEGESRRPTAIVATYRIDGNEGMRIFPNGREA